VVLVTFFYLRVLTIGIDYNKEVIDMHHEGGKELKCEACDIKFENQEEMDKHMKEAHGQESSGGEHGH